MKGKSHYCLIEQLLLAVVENEGCEQQQTDDDRDDDHRRDEGGRPRGVPTIHGLNLGEGRRWGVQLFSIAVRSIPEQGWKQTKSVSTTGISKRMAHFTAHPQHPGLAGDKDGDRDCVGHIDNASNLDDGGIRGYIARSDRA